jgi:hypothetical protein
MKTIIVLASLSISTAALTSQATADDLYSGNSVYGYVPPQPRAPGESNYSGWDTAGRPVYGSATTLPTGETLYSGWDSAGRPVYGRGETLPQQQPIPTTEELLPSGNAP